MSVGMVAPPSVGADSQREAETGRGVKKVTDPYIYQNMEAVWLFDLIVIKM